MRLLAFTFLFLGFVCSGAAFSKSKKTTWCCKVGEEIAKAPGKKEVDMCIRSKRTPSADAKSKLVRKYAKSCKKAEGNWEEKVK